MPERRPSIADAVALACKAQADLLGRPLTDEEHGCIHQGFHAGLLFHMEREVDEVVQGAVGRARASFDEMKACVIQTHELRGVRPAEHTTTREA